MVEEKTKEFNALKFVMNNFYGYSTVEQLVEKLEPLGWKRRPSRKGVLLLKNFEETNYCGIIKEKIEKNRTSYIVFSIKDDIGINRYNLNSAAALRWLERYAINIY